LIVGGLVIQLARRQWMTALYVIAYAGIVSLTPWPGQWMRYWWPLAPFLLLALLQCCLALRDLLSSVLPSLLHRVIAAFPAVLLCALLLVESLTIVDSYRRARGDVVLHDGQGSAVRFQLFFYDEAYRELDEALTWLKARARPDDTIAVAMPLGAPGDAREDRDAALRSRPRHRSDVARCRTGSICRPGHHGRRGLSHDASVDGEGVRSLPRSMEGDLCRSLGRSVHL
jgi:hypothetical protein